MGKGRMFVSEDPKTKKHYIIAEYSTGKQVRAKELTSADLKKIEELTHGNPLVTGPIDDEELDAAVQREKEKAAVKPTKKETTKATTKEVKKAKKQEPPPEKAAPTAKKPPPKKDAPPATAKKPPPKKTAAHPPAVKEPSMLEKLTARFPGFTGGELTSHLRGIGNRIIYVPPEKPGELPRGNLLPVKKEPPTIEKLIAEHFPGYTPGEIAAPNKGIGRSIIVVPPEKPAALPGGGFSAPPALATPESHLKSMGFSDENISLLKGITEKSSPEAARNFFKDGISPKLIEHVGEVNSLPKLIKSKDGAYIDIFTGEVVPNEHARAYLGTHSVDRLNRVGMQTDVLASQIEKALGRGAIPAELADRILYLSKLAGVNVEIGKDPLKALGKQVGKVVEILSIPNIAKDIPNMTAAEVRDLYGLRNQLISVVKTGDPMKVSKFAERLNVLSSKLPSLKGKGKIAGVTIAALGALATVLTYLNMDKEDLEKAFPSTPPPETAPPTKAAPGGGGRIGGPGPGAGTVRPNKMYDTISGTFKSIIDAYEKELQAVSKERDKAIEDYQNSTKNILQKGIIGKMMGEIGTDVTETELNALLLNAAYSMPASVYDAQIGNIVKGFYAAKKAGVKVSVANPQALAGFAELGQAAKTGNELIDTVLNYALNHAGQEFELTVKPKIERAKELEKEIMETQTERLKQMSEAVRTAYMGSIRLSETQIQAGAHILATQIAAAARGGSEGDNSGTKIDPFGNLGKQGNIQPTGPTPPPQQ